MRDFNFFAPYLGQQKKTKDKLTYVVGVVSVLAFIILGTYIWNTFNIAKLKKDISRLKSDIEASDNRAKYKEAEELIKKQDVLNKYYEGVTAVNKSIIEREAVSSDLMQKLAGALPQNVSFNTISIDGATIAIQGASRSRTAIAELQYNLKRFPVIREVHINNIGEGNSSKGDYSFTIKCTLKGVD